VHLVDNAGVLTLLHRVVCQIPDPGDDYNLVDKRMYMVYRVDLNTGKMRVMSKHLLALLPPPLLPGRACSIVGDGNELWEEGDWKK
jgi:hypothetical protein